MRHHRLSNLQSRKSLQVEREEQVGLDSYHSIRVSLPLLREGILFKAYDQRRLGDTACVIARQVVVCTYPAANVPMVSHTT